MNHCYLATFTLIASLGLGVSACNISDDEPFTGIGADSGNVGTMDGGTEDLVEAEEMGTESDTGTEDDMGTAGDGFVVFADDYQNDSRFSPFANSSNDVAITSAEAYAGTSALRAGVPGSGYTGGALVADTPVDLSDYNALSVWVKASKPAVLDVLGYGNSSDDGTMQIQARNTPVSTDWQQVLIPFPDPELMSATRGLLHFAEGADEGTYELFFDEVTFVSVDPETFTGFVGQLPTTRISITVDQTRTLAEELTFRVQKDGAQLTFEAQPFYFELNSSNQSVLSIVDGVLRGLDTGESVVTGQFVGQPAEGEFVVEVVRGPERPAPVPSVPSSQVIASIYSNSFMNRPVNTFLAPFSSAQLTRFTVDGDETLYYTDLDFAGIEFIGRNSIDISGATHVHFDMWTANASTIGFKLVDFGANNVFDSGGGDDSEAQINLADGGAFQTGRWVQIDLPLATFRDGGLRDLGHISQIIIVGLTKVGQTEVPGMANVFIDNIFFYRN